MKNRRTARSERAAPDRGHPDRGHPARARGGEAGERGGEAARASVIARTRVRRTALEKFDVFLRSNAVRLVLLLLVANTILAQAFFNSGGRILVGQTAIE